MHDFRFGETDRSTCESLDSGSEIKMFSFEFLSVSFAGLMFLGFEQIKIGPPIIRKPLFDPDAVFFE